MSARTPRFGFNAFGGSIPGALSDDGAKHTGADRFLLDKVLAALEARNPAALPVAALTAPSTAPALNSSSQPGTLRAGRTFSYVTTWVGADGLETLPSPATTASTPAALTPPQGAPALETVTGGTLVPGLYYYALTAVADSSPGAAQSALGAVATAQVLTDGERTVRLTVAATADGAPVRVWRRAQNEAAYTAIATTATSATTTTVVNDTGSVAADPNAWTAQPPPTGGPSIGTGAYALQVTQLDARPAGALSWRIYRTETPGVFGASSLVHDVTESDSYGTPLDRWVDTGAALSPGAPPQRPQQLGAPAFALASGTALPPVSGLADYFPFVLLDGDKRVLHAKVGSTWVVLAGAGGGGGAWKPGTAIEAGALLTSNGQALVAVTDVPSKGRSFTTKATGDWYASAGWVDFGSSIFWTYYPADLTSGDVADTARQAGSIAGKVRDLGYDDGGPRGYDQQIVVPTYTAGSDRDRFGVWLRCSASSGTWGIFLRHDGRLIKGAPGATPTSDFHEDPQRALVPGDVISITGGPNVYPSTPLTLSATTATGFLRWSQTLEDGLPDWVEYIGGPYAGVGFQQLASPTQQARIGPVTVATATVPLVLPRAQLVALGAQVRTASDGSRWRLEVDPGGVTTPVRTQMPGPPGPTGTPAVSGTGASKQLAWTEPAATGGLAVAGYVVSFFDGVSVSTSHTSAPSLSLAERPFTANTVVTVAARNAVGVGAPVEIVIVKGS